MASIARIAVIGAGPAGLMAAEAMAGRADVTVYDRMPSAGRKFLLAGRGGLNLTHSEDLEAFMPRYGAAEPRLRAAIDGFPPAALRQWAANLGQQTFVGSSGRVFPQLLKTSPLLRAWLQRLDSKGVKFALRHHWLGWDAGGALLFEGQAPVQPDAVVLALGGASWPKLGSDGGWVDALTQAGVTVAPLRPANCGFIVQWTDFFRDKYEGHPLKRIALTLGETTVRGEAVITREGLEGGAVYALSAPLRDAIDATGEVLLKIALRPDMTHAELQQRLQAPRDKQSFANVLRKTIKLSPAAIGMLHEAAVASGHKLSAMSAQAVATLINGVTLCLTDTAPVTRAISTAGGIAFDDPRPGEMAAQEGGEFRIALDQGKAVGGNARGEKRVGDLARPRAQLDHVAVAALHFAEGRPCPRLGEQPPARHDRPHREGPTQPALQEQGGAGARGEAVTNLGHDITLTDAFPSRQEKAAAPYCAGCMADSAEDAGVGVSNAVRACRICSTALTMET